MVVHGGIDGLSRTVVYLHCSTNNHASTVMASFLDAVRKYGLPDQVISDYGGENVATRLEVNVRAAQFSIYCIGIGSSTHNERSERLWRDVHRCVAVLFADLFREMEADGTLSCLNEIDMFCLHKVFLQRINSALTFVESWNNHPPLTSQNLTPNQLFIQGALTQNMTSTNPIPVPANGHFQMPVPHAAVDTYIRT